MFYREMNKQNGTLKDIQHLSSVLESFFLYKGNGTLAALQLCNYFELLIQSARTRLCIFQAPPNSEEYSRKEILSYIKATTFRTCEFYTDFIEVFTQKINQDRKKFLENDCLSIQSQTECLYIVLTRICPITHELSVGVSRSYEAYARLDMLLRNLSEESYPWGLNMEETLYQSFINSSPKHSTDCLLQRDRGDGFFSIEEHPEKIKINRRAIIEHQHEIDAWVDFSYQRMQQMPLLKTTDPENRSQFLEHGNIFFYVRLNTSVDKGKCRSDCNNFEVRQIVPKSQKQHLGQYIHKARNSDCSWFKGSKCLIQEMGDCVMQPYWQDADTLETEEEIYQHYAPLWNELEQVVPAHKMGSVLNSLKVVSIDKFPNHLVMILN